MPNAEDEILPLGSELGIGFVAYSPLGRGFEADRRAGVARGRGGRALSGGDDGEPAGLIAIAPRENAKGNAPSMPFAFLRLSRPETTLPTLIFFAGAHLALFRRRGVCDGPVD